MVTPLGSKSKYILYDYMDPLGKDCERCSPKIQVGGCQGTAKRQSTWSIV